MQRLERVISRRKGIDVRSLLEFTLNADLAVPSRLLRVSRLDMVQFEEFLQILV
jgi:hypothetical protein